MHAVISAIFMLLMAIIWLIYIGCGFVVTGLFVYGVYALFAKSVGMGLILIGASALGAFVVEIAFGLLMSAGMAIISGIAALAGVADRWNNKEG